ncbi:MAG: hypothetical protein AB7H77_08380 [Bdellovibrionales bacterium]
MSNNPVTSSGVGRLTGFVIGLVVFSCLLLIGFSGYFKYQLDRAEAAMAAPEGTVSADQGAYQKLRRALGYGGFVGSAQSFIATRDRAAIGDMKTHLKTAQDVLARLPERTPPDARHDLQSIADIFAAAANKAEQSVNDPAVAFGAPDMAPLYGALPVIDQRAAAAMAGGRYAAQAQVKLWATLLTLVAWGSLIVAAACAVGVYLNLRGRQAAPFRALAQSVQNMARGDMRTPIWGMERQDMVGELARAVDLARYHFSQLPDMSLLSEQGPLRIRFEGQARSLFEAMMQSIGKDSETIRSQATGLAEAVSKQKDAVAMVAARVEEALGGMQRERQGSERQVQQLLQTIGGSAQTLRGAQQAAEAQLNHLIAYLEERARGMAEVTQIAGKQVAQTLQSLSVTEHSLRASAEKNQQTVGKLAESTDQLGERLFGAVSLLRAGGKVLTETAEATQQRLNEAISLLSQSEGSLRQMLVQGFEPVGNAAAKAGSSLPASEAERLQAIVGGLEGAQRKLEECLARQTEAAGTTAETLASVTGHLQQERDRLGATGTRLESMLDQIGGKIERRVMESLGRSEIANEGFTRLSDLATQLGGMIERLAPVASAEAQGEPPAEALPDTVLMEIKTGFEITARSIQRLREEFINAALTQPASPISAEAGAAPATAALPDQSNRIIEEIAAANERVTRALTLQAERIEARLAALDKKMASGGTLSPGEAESQLQQQAQVLSELATALSSIDAHMQEMGETFKTLGHVPNGGRWAS